MSPVLLQLGPLKVHGYGFMFAVGGVLVGWWLWRRRARIGVKDADEFFLLFNAVLLSAMVTGKLLYVLEYTRLGTPQMWRSLVSPSSGFSFFGGFLGTVAAMWWYTRRTKTDFWVLADHAFWMIPAWHVPGRVGCFLAGCCFGRPAELPWAVTFTDPAAMVPRRLLGVPLHPTQLYEAAAEGVIALLLLPLLDKKPGTTTAAYFMLYGVLRFVLEFYRGDGVATGRFTAGQWLGVGLFAAGAMVLWYTRCSRRS
ncbi:MAG: prolipoprotein diacylglyceryl transferase [Elusimicrobiota bacterium]|nr:prolipoprotein diacylglyceryl transferase [Elusimicrobiota bacterium]